MIDLIYTTLLTILNKENQGYVSPIEFNTILNHIQNEIYRGYFEEENLDKNKQNRGMTNNGYSNLSFNQRQRIQQFSAISTLTVNSGFFNLPDDLYLIEDNGILSGASTSNYNTVVEEVDKNQYNYLIKSSCTPTELYPIYEKYGSQIKVFPTTITEIELRYLRKPKIPNWTYIVTASGDPMFNQADPAFQDIELHDSEFSNIVIRMLSYFGITLREGDVIQVAEQLKDKMNLKDNG